MGINNQIRLLAQLKDAYTDGSFKYLKVDKSGELKRKNILSQIVTKVKFFISSEGAKENLKERKIKDLTSTIESTPSENTQTKEPTRDMIVKAKFFLSLMKKNSKLVTEIRTKIYNEYKIDAELSNKLDEYITDRIFNKIDSLYLDRDRARIVSQLSLNDKEIEQLELAKKTMDEITKEGLSNHPASSAMHPDHELFEKCRAITKRTEITDLKALKEAQKLHQAFKKEYGEVSVNKYKTVSQCSKKQLQGAMQLLKKEMPFLEVNTRDNKEIRTKLLLTIMHGKKAASDIYLQKGFKDDLNVFEIKEFATQTEQYKFKNTEKAHGMIDAREIQKSAYLEIASTEEKNTQQLFEESMEVALKDWTNRALLTMKMPDGMIRGHKEVVNSIIEQVQNSLLDKIKSTNKEDQPALLRKLQEQVIPITDDYLEAIRQNTHESKKEFLEEVIIKADLQGDLDWRIDRNYSEDVKNIIFDHVFNHLLLANQQHFATLLKKYASERKIEFSNQMITVENKEYMISEEVQEKKELTFDFSSDKLTMSLNNQLLINGTTIAKGRQHTTIPLLVLENKDRFITFNPQDNLRFNVDALEHLDGLQEVMDAQKRTVNSNDPLYTVKGLGFGPMLGINE